MAKPAKRARDTYHVGNLAPQLLAAARALLEEVGPTKLSLRAVSERVGVSATAAYHHFQNRNELIGQLAAQGFAELARALQRAYSNGSGLNKLRAGSLAYLHFARSNPALYQLMFGPEFTEQTMIPALQRERPPLVSLSAWWPIRWDKTWTAPRCARPRSLPGLTPMA